MDIILQIFALYYDRKKYVITMSLKMIGLTHFVTVSLLAFFHQVVSGFKVLLSFHIFSTFIMLIFTFS